MLTLEDYEKYDIKNVLAWTAPKENGAPLMTMPNIPHPLHGMAPRTILGPTTWDHMRKRCYYDAGYKCQACGRDLDKGECHAHEVYSINYYAGESKFVRTVCLCPLCHVYGIHSGRALTMFKKGDVRFTKNKILEGVENLFKQLYTWNKEHPNEPPLRAYVTLIDYAKWPPIAKEMDELIKKYDVKFYTEDYDYSASWKKWHLIIGHNSYPTKYENQADWEIQMTKKNKAEQKIIKRLDTGGIFDEVDKIIKEDNEEKEK